MACRTAISQKILAFVTVKECSVKQQLFKKSKHMIPKTQLKIQDEKWALAVTNIVFDFPYFPDYQHLQKECLEVISSGSGLSYPYDEW